MSATHRLHDLGQSIWLDNITRALLSNGTLSHYIAEFSVSGFTSNPTIFGHAIRNGDFYDAAIRKRALAGKTDETIIAAVQLHGRAQRPNLFIKIPDTRAGISAIEESIFAGVPVNVTLLFSREHYIAAAEAYMRGIGRRMAAGLDPKTACVASMFVGRWDFAVRDEVRVALRNCLGIAIARRTYRAYRDLLASPRWQKLARAGARPQRLLWASTGTKDPTAPDVLYVEALAKAGRT